MLRAAIRCLQRGFQFHKESIGELTLEESNVCIGFLVSQLESCRGSQ